MNSEEKKEYRKRYYRENREKLLAKNREYSKKYYHANKKKAQAQSKAYREAHKEELRQKAVIHGKEFRAILRAEVLVAYGNKCSCCGESNPIFLCIDHVNGGGNKHRKEIGSRVYSWLRQNNFPDGFQILCHNCNHAKSDYGVCPHQKSRE